MSYSAESRMKIKKKVKTSKLKINCVGDSSRTAKKALISCFSCKIMRKSTIKILAKWINMYEKIYGLFDIKKNTA
jgi:hypothetical protein